jgi:RNA polymerase sigma-70 factor (sigma-E family)
MNGRGDEDYGECVRQLLPDLRRTAHLLTGDWHRADELVQDTIVQAYVKWHHVRNADNTVAYVRKILMRRFLGERRTLWRTRVWVTADVPDAPTGDGDIAAAMDVRRALAKVPPRQRAALVLRFYCDLTVAQAAEVLGCSSGTVKSQTSRGLDTLRRALTGSALSNLSAP